MIELVEHLNSIEEKVLDQNPTNVNKIATGTMVYGDLVKYVLIFTAVYKPLSCGHPLMASSVH